jgi:hypothetical protein
VFETNDVYSVERSITLDTGTDGITYTYAQSGYGTIDCIGSAVEEYTESGSFNIGDAEVVDANGYDEDGEEFTVGVNLSRTVTSTSDAEEMDKDCVYSEDDSSYDCEIGVGRFVGKDTLLSQFEALLLRGDDDDDDDGSLRDNIVMMMVSVFDEGGSGPSCEEGYHLLRGQ